MEGGREEVKKKVTTSGLATRVASGAVSYMLLDLQCNNAGVPFSQCGGAAGSPAFKSWRKKPVLAPF